MIRNATDELLNVLTKDNPKLKELADQYGASVLVFLSNKIQKKTLMYRLHSLRIKI